MVSFDGVAGADPGFVKMTGGGGSNIFDVWLAM